MKPSRFWLVFALVTTFFWGVWGAFIEVPEKAGFPATLGYSVWALTMVPCALIALGINDFKLHRDRRAVVLCSIVGFLGAGGQLILFQALRTGPAYLVFPIISLYPVVSVFLSAMLLKERTTRRVWTGIALAFPAVVMLSYQPPSERGPHGFGWLALAIAVALMWGVQAYVMKVSTAKIPAESVFFYMMATAVVLVPVAIGMTDFSRPVFWGFKGPWLAALVQSLNSIGALSLVYALRHGKAIVVVPMTALAPVLTVVLSLFLYGVVPHPVVATGLVSASLAIFLMAE